jgi:hypothetical protein
MTVDGDTTSAYIPLANGNYTFMVNHSTLMTNIIYINLGQSQNWCWVWAK